jgi:hypothetical protein
MPLAKEVLPLFFPGVERCLCLGKINDRVRTLIDNPVQVYLRHHPRFEVSGVIGPKYESASFHVVAIDHCLSASSDTVTKAIGNAQIG